MLASAEIEWQWSYGGDGYEPRHFYDWIHMTRPGGRRYVERLFAAIPDGRVLTDASCDSA